MKISITTIKNILMLVRDLDFSLENFNLGEFLEKIDHKIVNEICKEITGKDYDYAGDLLGEDGAIEVLSDFLLNIINSWEKSKNFRTLIKRFLPEKMEALTKLKKQLE